MTQRVYFIVFLLLFGCHYDDKPAIRQDAAPLSQDQQLEAYLDSVGRLPTRPLAEQGAFFADSVFRSHPRFARVVSAADLAILKTASREGVMAVKTAKRIFADTSIDINCNTKSVLLTYPVGIIPISYYLFNKESQEYALCVGDPGHCSSAALYFFKGNNIIARHRAYNRYDLGLQHYKDTDGRTVIYYTMNFTSGSGIWWNQYFFYKYIGNTLAPVLTELENGNLQSPSPWGVRTFWLKSTVEKTNPLTLKMVYYSQLPDTAESYDGPGIIDDSTSVEYTWNAQTQMLEGQYQKSKISRPQIFSYYVQDNDILFINAYYHPLKSALQDTASRKATLMYLHQVKSHYQRR